MVLFSFGVFTQLTQFSGEGGDFDQLAACLGRNLYRM